MATDSNRFQAIIAHCKEYGFIFPSSEIYDGLGAVYDYGQWGSELKKNIKDYWWKSMVQSNFVFMLNNFSYKDFIYHMQKALLTTVW